MSLSILGFDFWSKLSSNNIPTIYIANLSFIHLISVLLFLISTTFLEISSRELCFGRTCQLELKGHVQRDHFDPENITSLGSRNAVQVSHLVRRNLINNTSNVLPGRTANSRRRWRIYCKKLKYLNAKDSAFCGTKNHRSRRPRIPHKDVEMFDVNALHG